MSERAAPFYCPYCGDESLVPSVDDDGGAGHGRWECRACTRIFSVRFVGLAARP